MLIYSNWENLTLTLTLNVHSFFKVHTDRSMYIVTRRQLTLTDPHTFFFQWSLAITVVINPFLHINLWASLFIEDHHHQQLAHLHFSHTKPAKNQTHSAIDSHGKVSQRFINIYVIHKDAKKRAFNNLKQMAESFFPKPWLTPMVTCCRRFKPLSHNLRTQARLLENIAVVFFLAVSTSNYLHCSCGTVLASGCSEEWRSTGCVEWGNTLKGVIHAYVNDCHKDSKARITWLQGQWFMIHTAIECVSLCIIFCNKNMVQIWSIKDCWSGLDQI